MSLNAAAIETLIAKGLSASDILDVARSLERRRDNTNAERQARHRAKRKAGKDNGVTVTGVTGVSPKSNNQTPSLDTPVISDEMTSPPQIELKPDQVIEAWNVMADETGLPKAKMTPERRKKLATFIRRHTIDDITEAIWTIPRTPFLLGENDRGWKANLDFFLQPSSFTKISEGTYGQQSDS